MEHPIHNDNFEEHTHHYSRHSSEHGHHHHDLSEKNLLWATVMNFIITIAEVIGGIASNSLALLSDAIHNLGDTVAILIAYIANRVSKISANEHKTFGYKRVEILAALFNAVALIVITVFLFREAWLRFNNPEPVKGIIMFVVAVIGLLANVVSVFLLRKDSDKNINIRAAYLHLLGDAISSVAVIIGSLLMIFFGVFWVDPLITVAVGLYILKEAYSVMRETVDILMQATPKSMNLPQIKEALELVEGIDNIHHVHIWKLSDDQVHFECHADVSTDLRITETEPILYKIGNLLENKFGISHVTIQFEHYCCEEKNLIHNT